MTEKKLKGTRTEQNLINAFAGESQARNRYTYFAKQAKKDGFEQISEIFTLTADNEKEHAKKFYEYIGNTKGHVDSEYPFELGTTEQNLKSAIEGENEEAEILYSEAEKVAQEEGFDEIAATFHNVIKAEKHHRDRFAKLLDNIENKTVFKKDKDTNWMCRKCGFVCCSKTAPTKCPSCEHPQEYFQVLCEEY